MPHPLISPGCRPLLTDRNRHANRKRKKRKAKARLSEDEDASSIHLVLDEAEGMAHPMESEGGAEYVQRGEEANQPATAAIGSGTCSAATVEAALTVDAAATAAAVREVAVKPPHSLRAATDEIAPLSSTQASGRREPPEAEPSSLFGRYCRPQANVAGAGRFARVQPNPSVTMALAQQLAAPLEEVGLADPAWLERRASLTSQGR